MPCIHQVPHLNALFERKKELGLVVVGVTGDAMDEVKTFVEQHRVGYPIGIGGHGGYEVRGIPHAFLIGIDGKILWRGHPGTLEDAQIDAALVGARPAVVAAGLEPVHALRRQGDHGAARRQANELLAGGTLSERAQTQARTWVQEIEQTVADALAVAEQALHEEDAYTAWLRLGAVAKGYDGVPGVEDAKARFEAIQKDGKHKREIAAGIALAEARALEAARDFDGAHKALKAVASAWSSTKAGKEAKEAYRAIEKDGKLGYMRGCGACEASGAACPRHKKKR